MPHVQYTADGGTYRIRGYSFEPGDEREVEQDLADYLADHDEFEVDDAGDDAAAQEDEPPDEDDAEGEADGEAEAGEFDVDEFLDRNVEPVAEDIRAGGVDEHLDAIADAAERVTVQDAIGERRADLEE